MAKRSRRGFSSFATTAVLSVALLIFAGIWVTTKKNTPLEQTQEIARASDEEMAPASDLVVTDARSTATSSETGLSPLGDAVLNKVMNAYSALSQDGNVSGDASANAAQAIAQSLQPVVQTRAYTPIDLKTTADISLARVLAYRSDLRDSLTPLLSITEPEYATFGHYVESHDPSYLAILQHDADHYRAAASSTTMVIVPQDAVPHHIAILNAMQEFAGVLDALSSHASDPFATAALLRSYNHGEEDMLTSFNNLAQYYRTKANAAASASSTNS